MQLLVAFNYWDMKLHVYSTRFSIELGIDWFALSTLPGVRIKCL